MARQDYERQGYQWQDSYDLEEDRLGRSWLKMYKYNIKYHVSWCRKSLHKMKALQRWRWGYILDKGQSKTADRKKRDNEHEAANGRNDYLLEGWVIGTLAINGIAG